MKEEKICEHCGKDHSVNTESEYSELLPEESLLLRLSDFFKIFGDTTRLKILVLLDKEPLYVCGIAEALGMTKSAVSHQLKLLRQHDLIRSQRCGKNVLYSLADSHVRDIVEKAIEHLEE